MKLTAAIIVVSASLAATAVHSAVSGRVPRSADEWSYKSPNKWGEECKLGKAQSPVDITDEESKDLGNLKAVYSGKARAWDFNNNGHTLQLSVDVNGGYADDMTLSGGGLEGDYKLAQFHFHWGSNNTNGSEHTIGGRAYAAELHLVHVKSSFKNMKAALKSDRRDALAVVGLFFKVSSHSNPFIQQVLDSRTFAKVSLDEGHEEAKFAMDFSQLQPKACGLYRYRGSLTTPQCNEEVEWAIVTTPLDISEDQLEMLRHIHYHGGFLQDNDRPTQPLNGRVIAYDPISCFKVRLPKKKRGEKKTPTKYETKKSKERRIENI